MIELDALIAAAVIVAVPALMSLGARISVKSAMSYLTRSCR